jgi:hypothetical protein
MKWWMAIGCIVLLLMAGIASAAGTDETTRHFEIVSINPVSTNSYDLGNLLERCYYEVNSIWGSAPDHIKVIIVGKKSMDQVGEHVEAFSAWNRESSSIVLRQESLKNKNSLKVAAEHEMCHICINPYIADKDCKNFNWMEEGICMVVSKEPFDDTKVSKSIVKYGFMSVPEIASAVDNDNYNVSKNGYLESYSLVKYISLRYGMDAIVRMIESPEKNFDTAFEEATGEDFSTFYHEWESYVRMKSAGSTGQSRLPSTGYRQVSRPAYAF